MEDTTRAGTSDAGGSTSAHINNELESTSKADSNDPRTSQLEAEDTETKKEGGAAKRRTRTRRARATRLDKDGKLEELAGNYGVHEDHYYWWLRRFEIFHRNAPKDSNDTSSET